MISLIERLIRSNKYTFKFAKFIIKYINFIKLKKVVNNYQVNKSNKSVFFMLNQEHGNLGDIAIGYSQKIFVKEYFPNYNLIGITEREYNIYTEYFMKIIKPEDIIVLIGGGSIGDQYLSHENSRRDIINRFKKNKIISFPQSMYFSSTKQGKEELEKSRIIYSSHPNLFIVARDKITYEHMKSTFTNNKVLLTPDIVLFLNKTLPKKYREGAIAFIRSDVESILSKEEKEEIAKNLGKYFEKYIFSDTVINREVSRDRVEIELNNIIEKFKSAELVITDRLHGMVFAAITGTPCIVLTNYNHKIRGQYEWISELEYIKFTDDIDKIGLLIQDLKKIQSYEYNNTFIKNYYKEIVDAMKN